MPEVAKLSNRHKQTVWRDVRRGILPAKLIGGMYLISLKDLQAYLQRPKETLAKRRSHMQASKKKSLAANQALKIKMTKPQVELRLIYHRTEAVSNQKLNLQDQEGI